VRKTAPRAHGAAGGVRERIPVRLNDSHPRVVPRKMAGVCVQYMPPQVQQRPRSSTNSSRQL